MHQRIMIPRPSASSTFSSKHAGSGKRSATVVLFWVPRVIDRSLPTLGMPAFTTNVEFGFHIGKNPAKVIYGHPEGAPKTRYLDALYTEHTGRQPSTTLEETITQAIACAKALQMQDN